MQGDVILRRCRKYAQEAAALRARIRRKREMATVLTREIGNEGRGGAGEDRMAAFSSQVDELERLKKLRERRYEAEIEAAEKIFDQMEQSVAEVAYLYYVRGLGSKEIAARAHRSSRSVQMLRSDAERQAQRMEIAMPAWYASDGR